MKPKIETLRERLARLDSDASTGLWLPNDARSDRQITIDALRNIHGYLIDLRSLLLTLAIVQALLAAALLLHVAGAI